MEPDEVDRRPVSAPDIFAPDIFEGLPRGHYGAILIDPPWAFRTYGGDNATPHRSAEDHYKTMDFDALKAMPVGDLAAKNCALFMWVVGSHIDQALELGQAWGFKMTTDAFYWMKERMFDAGRQMDFIDDDCAEPVISMGYWTRKQVEPCFLFKKGSPPRLSKGVRQVIVEPRREHSRKPDAINHRIEQLVAGPYLEIFGRTNRPGWDIWGNEAGRWSAAA